MPEYSPTKRYRRGFLSMVFRLPNAPFQTWHSWQPRKAVLNLQHMKSDVQLRVVNPPRPPFSLLVSAGVPDGSSAKPVLIHLSLVDLAERARRVQPSRFPRRSPGRRLQWVQWVQWFQWHQCVQCVLESLVRHLKPRRASMLVVKLLVDQGGDRQVGGGKDFVKTSNGGATHNHGGTAARPSHRRQDCWVLIV